MNQFGDESRFQKLERLGRGGTAEVFRVRLAPNGQFAALKLPLPEPVPGVDFELLAARESKLLAGRRFPGLVRILNRPDDPSTFLILELCEGKTLDQLEKVSDLGLALNLLSALAADLEYLRQNEIIHGDLKPHNVFLPQGIDRCSTGQLFFLKLSDFSLGKYRQEPDTARAGLGTVGYMAPETVLDGTASHRSDLFALGVIAYQLLTGIHPFIDSDADPMRINARVREEDPPPVNQVREDIPGMLSSLISNLLLKQPERRIATALAVCQALRQCGATYPYERLLRSKYLLESFHTYEAGIERLPSLTEKQKHKLDLMTSSDRTLLRFALEMNQQKGLLSIHESGLQLSGTPYWPSRFRRSTLQRFVDTPLKIRKQQVRNAAIETVDASDISTLLLPLIRPSTVRRLAGVAAENAEQAERYADATALYLRAGDLQGADRTAYQAASLLRGQHRSREAVLCINAVADYAMLAKAMATVRPLLMLRGDIQKETGQVDEALATYQHIVSLYQSLPADKLLAETYRDLGDLYKMKQDSKSGFEALNKAVDIYRDMGEDLELSRTYNNIGNSYFYTGDLTSTLRQYRRALQIQRRLDAETEIASTLSNMGSVFCLKGKLNRGILLLEKSLELKKRLGDAGEIARTLNNLGYIRFLQGEFDRSSDQLQESLAINRRIGSKKEELFNLENLTMVLLEAGHLRDALVFLNQGLALAVELNQLPHQATFQHSLAQVHLRLGKLKEAANCLDKVGSLLEQVEDVHWQVQMPLSRALLAIAVGDRQTAKMLTLKAVDVSVSLAIPTLQLSALLQLCRLEDDEQVHQQTIRLARELGRETDIVVAAYNRAEFYAENEEHEKADALLKELLPLQGEIPSNVERPRLLIILSELLLFGEQYDLAYELAQQARDSAVRSGLVCEQAHATVLLGKMEVRAGEIEKAYANYRTSLQIIKSVADSTSSDADRKSLQSGRIVKFLVSEIRRLSSILDQKQRAGTPALR